MRSPHDISESAISIRPSAVAVPPCVMRGPRRALRLTAHGFARPFAQRAAVICTNPLDRDACPASAFPGHPMSTIQSGSVL